MYKKIINLLKNRFGLPYTDWVLKQISMHIPGASNIQEMSIQNLVSGIETINERRGQIFGLEFSLVERRGYSAIYESLVKALISWKEKFQKSDDIVGLMAMNKVGEKYQVDALKIQNLPSYDFEALSKSLSEDWQMRLKRIQESIKSAQGLNSQFLTELGFEEAESEVEFGKPNIPYLSEFIFVYEEKTKRIFPKEIIAFWSKVNGIVIDDEELLSPCEDWKWCDEGLMIGQKWTSQTELILEFVSDEISSQSKVIQRDDDGVECASYPNFTSFVDAGLGS